ncbi:hypothetical protein GPJ56_004485 [Histomonas meleagridis]|uniref:uncharacterized protein n=1 Tax=Histomonas meleagridis TaxID=135588 RepID=UPI003559FAFC|nr:hypothetical protein GPJ56_004485 [Histomonas meleagridis]KAH0801987.1 hypothetical protein GO595_005068 [Histomonas meleagridis]
MQYDIKQGICTIKATKDLIDQIKEEVFSQVGQSIDDSIMQIILQKKVVKNELPRKVENKDNTISQAIQDLIKKYNIESNDGKRYTLTYGENEAATIDKTFNGKNRYVVHEDNTDSNSLIYMFDLDSANKKIKIRRSPKDKNDTHFYTTSLSLLGLYSSNKIVLNSFTKRAASYLSFSLENPFEFTDDVDVSTIPEFLPDLIGKVYDPIEISSFTKLTFTIPIPKAIFIIEIYATNQPEEEKCNFNKIFMDKKYVYTLSILGTFPVLFELNGSSVNLSFADTSIATAETIKGQVELALNIFNNVKMDIARFINVDAFNYDIGYAQKMSRELGYALIRGDNIENEQSLGSFMIWCVPSAPGPEARNKFEEKCRKDYEEIKMYLCSKCCKYISKGYSGECFLQEHLGEKIPFDDGKMEQTEYTPDGEITLVKYSCCGQIPKFMEAEGCSKMVFPCHMMTEQSPSQLEFMCSSC